MPKVSVITLPAKMLEVKQQVVGKKTAKRRPSLTMIFNKIIAMLMALVGKEDSGQIAILAFFLGRVFIMGECAPIGLAFFTAMAQIDEQRAFRVGLWSVVGVLSGGYYSEAGIYILAMGSYFLYADKLASRGNKSIVIPLFMFLAILCAGLIMNIINEFTLYRFSRLPTAKAQI